MNHFMAFIGAGAVTSMWVWWMAAVLNRFIVASAVWATLLTGAVAFVVLQYIVNPETLWAGAAGSAFGSLIGVMYADIE